MAQQFLDYAGLQEFWSKIKGFMATNYVAKVDGKDLSTNDYTTAEKNKLAGIATGAQVNVIETVKLGGTALTVSDKSVNIPVESTLSDSTNPIQTTVVNTAINTIATEVDKKVDAASGDAYYTLTKDGTSITGAATPELIAAITNANSALQKADITTGSSNGTISVGGSDVAVKGLGSAAYTESSAYAPASLSTQVETNKADIAALKGSVSGGVHFIGVVDAFPENAINGDVCIIGSKEYIYSKPQGSTTGEWIELGDTTAEDQRIADIEESYIKSFGGENGDITLDTDASGVGNVKFSMNNKELQATVNVGTTSFGGKIGDITLDTEVTAVGAVDFAMSGNKLTGTVVLPSIVNAITVGDTATIDMSVDTTTTPGTPKITATAITEAPKSDSGKLVTSGQVYTYVTDSINGLDSPNRVDSTASGTATNLKLVQVDVDTTAAAVSKSFEVVANVVQANGKVSASAVTIGPIPIDAITALS